MVTTIHNSALEYMSLYNDYVQTKITNEEVLVSHLSNYIPVTESVIGDKLQNFVKDKWESFVEFIENLVGKFLETISDKLLPQKTYLDKYQDIILNRKPKHIAFSFDGDYETAIKRCMETQIPVFNYDKHAELLANTDMSDSAIVKQILPSSNKFVYDEGSDASLADQLKTYFLGAENHKKTEGYFDTTKALNWTDMFNFCRNTKQIKEITRKDKAYLRQSTNAIMNACNREIKQSSEKTQTQQQDNSVVGDPNSPGARPTNNSNGTTTAKKESFYFFEADTDNGNATKSNLKIDDSNINTNAVSKMSSYANRDEISDQDKNDNAQAAVNANENTKGMKAITTRWIKICKTIIAAKLTIIQKLASDFMTIIRAHVRSYVGVDNKPEDAKESDQATNYGTGNENNSQQQNTKK